MRTGFPLTRLLLGGLVAVGALLSQAGSAAALSGSDFQAGRIIDNQVFYNGSDMSVAQIQSFLSLQVPTCDTNGNLPYYGTYGGHTYNGNILRKNLDPNYPPPYTCLKDYYENTTTHANNIGNPGNIPSGAISAAQIIADAAQTYNINPKVLLATMQKESLGPLITDDWPWSNEYTVPMGYGCPDSSVCDSQYYGLYNQVHNAARQFRLYTNNPNSYNYTIGTNSIKYHPDPSSCGTAQVNIQNQATANLYNYTPYVPNQAALNNLYGLGDGCSAYGNRNFWRIFNDWFGSPLLPSYASSYVSQSAYPTIITGHSTTVSFNYRNAGSQPWYDNVSAGGANAQPIHLATTHGMNRRSLFGNTWGGDQNRAAGTFAVVYEADGTTLATNQHVVQNGQIAKFSFTMSAPLGTTPGVYREFFQPIVEGTIGGNMNDPWTFLDVTVQPAVYTSAYVSQSPYPSLLPGQSAPSWFQYKNTGNQIWYDNTSAAGAGALPIHLATAHPLNRHSAFGATWGGDQNRTDGNFAAVYEADGTTLAADQHAVAPGQIAKFAFTLTAPSTIKAGTYREFFQPIVEGTADGAMNDPWTFLDITVQPAYFSSSYVGQSPYPAIARGSSATSYFLYRNNGTLPWYDNVSVSAGLLPVHLATAHPLNRHSLFGSTWGGDQNRAAGTFAVVYEADGTTPAANQHVVQPGQIAKISFTMSAPANAQPGVYREFFQPIVEGTADGAMNDPWTFLDVTIQ
ncbi:MAG TPA: hypothetical protein VLI05_06230 [Candidatus Saccharimonadia bacterium]|nr:hypothetical protein [Candidatus Saccharimonadia bacterium]